MPSRTSFQNGGTSTSRPPCGRSRHYRKEFAETDPSSPLRAHAAANADADAVGVVFWYDAAAARKAKVRHLTAAKDAVGIARQGWHHPNDKLTPTIEEVQPGVVEITATIGDGTTRVSRVPARAHGVPRSCHVLVMLCGENGVRLRVACYDDR